MPFVFSNPYISPDQIVSLNEIEPIMLFPGETEKIRIPVKVVENYRVQANPASSEFLFPLRLKITGNQSVHVGKPRYPSGQSYQLKGTNISFSVYRGTFDIIVPLKVSAPARPGVYVLKGVLSYQACSPQACLPPSSCKVQIKVIVASPLPNRFSFKKEKSKYL